jgi:hypothetical protein
MRKSAVLTRLALYFDVGAATLCPTGRQWSDLTAAELVAVMEPGRGGLQNKHSTDVVFLASDGPSLRVCVSIRHEGKSCFGIGPSACCQ